MTKIWQVGCRVKTPFIDGLCILIVDGGERGWCDCKYLLVQPKAKYCPSERPHWVRQDELGWGENPVQDVR